MSELRDAFPDVFDNLMKAYVGNGGLIFEYITTSLHDALMKEANKPDINQEDKEKLQTSIENAKLATGKDVVHFFQKWVRQARILLYYFSMNSVSWTR